MIKIYLSTLLGMDRMTQIELAIKTEIRSATITMNIEEGAEEKS